MSDATKIMLMSAGVIITCLLVWLGFNMANTAKQIGETTTSQMSELNNDLKDSDIKKFDGLEVRGSEVINFIKKYLGDYEIGDMAPICVNVKTDKSEYKHVNNEKVSNIKNFADNYYIKPTAVFLGEVIINENDIIEGVNFNQQ